MSNCAGELVADMFDGVSMLLSGLSFDILIVGPTIVDVSFKPDRGGEW